MSDVDDLIVDDGFAFDMPSPQSLRRGIGPSPFMNQDPMHDYNFSGNIYDESTDGAQSTEDEYHAHEDIYGNEEEEDHEEDNRSLRHITPSRHSSVSSFPASVVHHTPVYTDRPYTPSKLPSTHTSPRGHSTGFRHPSSVRALQMRDEYDFTDADDLTPNRQRRNSRMSYISYRSSGSVHSSPTKSLRTRSAQSSPLKSGNSKLKKEFPLVLLHCTLLPPPLFVRASVLSGEKEGKESVLEAIIPEPYAKRWKALQDKVVRNPEVRTRGVLIPHPREDYELLEERLLESLELEKPRIRLGHYIGPDEQSPSAVDSGFESADSSCNGDGSGEKDTHGERCPDCGHDFGPATEHDKKWDVKVFAANGLMKAGAWSAAWPEMEKVDIEVSMWMPEDVRREVDSRLEALIDKEREEKQEKQKKVKRRRRGIDDQRAREIYGEPVKPEEVEVPSQEQIDGLVVDIEKTTTTTSQQSHSHHDDPTTGSAVPQNRQSSQAEHEADLASAFARYLRLLAQDRRNVAIVLLFMLAFVNFSSHLNRTSPADDGIKTNEIYQQESSGAGPSTQFITETSTSLTVSTSTVISIVTSTAAATSGVADESAPPLSIPPDGMPLPDEVSFDTVHNDENFTIHVDEDSWEFDSSDAVQELPLSDQMTGTFEPQDSETGVDPTLIVATGLPEEIERDPAISIDHESMASEAIDEHAYLDLMLMNANENDEDNEQENEFSHSEGPGPRPEIEEDTATDVDL